MKRRPRPGHIASIPFRRSLLTKQGDVGIVLSGGGARAAYQVGALRALAPFLERDPEQVSVVLGSSIGAINGLVFSACLSKGVTHSIEVLDQLWRMRTYRNTFANSPSHAFMRAIRVAIMQYMAPGPHATSGSIFNPAPLMTQVDEAIASHGGLNPDHRAPHLKSVGVMTTIEGVERKPMLFVSTHRPFESEVLDGASFELCYVEDLTAKHGFASAALPSVLPPVELDSSIGKVRLVDGGISQNVPVDPAVRMGAHRVIVVDISGRNWWLDQYGESHDTRPKWEIPAAHDTFCLRPPETLVVRCQKPLGSILREAVRSSTKKFITAVGPTWPIFQLLKKKFGEVVAYEVMSYVALDPDYLTGIIEQGFYETTTLLRNKSDLPFVPEGEPLPAEQAEAVK